MTRLGIVGFGRFGRAFAELGTAVPWVATHPLFGPSALALGQRPLRVVVCPNPLHRDATDAVRRMFADTGCEVVDQDADTHDRLLARGHALTFFVAKVPSRTTCRTPARWRFPTSISWPARHSPS